MKKAPLRVGFDLDGVLLYNPARIIRRPVVLFKHIFLPKREKKFFVPKNRLTKFIFNSYFYMSFVFGNGLKSIEKVINNNSIEAYVITGRFEFAKKSTTKVFDQLNKKNIFKKLYVNENNIQPQIFKEKMIKELKLDIFVEDNIDIVRYLNKQKNADILWICNIFDALVDYPNKHNNLQSVAKQISSIARKI